MNEEAVRRAYREIRNAANSSSVKRAARHLHDAMHAEPEGCNVIVRMSVVRPDREFLPALLRHLNDGWNSYAGHMRIVDVEILSGESAFPPVGAAEAVKDHERGLVAVDKSALPEYPSDLP